MFQRFYFSHSPQASTDTCAMSDVVVSGGQLVHWNHPICPLYVPLGQGTQGNVEVRGPLDCSVPVYPAIHSERNVNSF